MKNKLNHFLFILLLFFTTQAHSNPIEKITFIGLNTTIESSIVDVLSFSRGKITQQKIAIKLLKSFLELVIFQT